MVVIIKNKMNKLPFDVVEIINEKVHKMNMTEYVIPQFHKTSHLQRYKNEVLPEMLKVSKEFTSNICVNCLEHGMMCLNCAQYNHDFVYGPGYAYGKRIVVDKDSLQSYEYLNLVVWSIYTNNEINFISYSDYQKLSCIYSKWIS